MYMNHYNWAAFWRAAWVFERPTMFARSILTQAAPAEMTLRTPIGRIVVALRNFESVRTLFSIFCRQDYLTPRDESALYLDVGANIGLAAAYFLSRNANNRAICFEPDAANLAYLERNLRQFGSRATFVPHAVGVTSGTMTLYRSLDGKYSSLIASDRANEPQHSIVDSFDDVLSDTARYRMPVVVKLDVEGLEPELVRHARFENHPQVSRVICESTECARLVSRPHRHLVRNGYIEDLTFVS